MFVAMETNSSFYVTAHGKFPPLSFPIDASGYYNYGKGKAKRTILYSITNGVVLGRF